MNVHSSSKPQKFICQALFKLSVNRCNRNISSRTHAQSAAARESEAHLIPALVVASPLVAERLEGAEVGGEAVSLVR